MILLIDNYDSFTYNLVQRIGEVFLRGRHEDTEARRHEVALNPLPSGEGRVRGNERTGMNVRAPSPPTPLPQGEGGRDARRLAGPEIRVVRNDKITVEEAAALNPTHLILSPGPCTPTESGICPQLIEHFMGRIPILGVCLGHQTIGHVRGMTVSRHHTLMHGKTSEIHHDGRGIYEGLSNPFTATRYHSLIVVRETVPADFEVSAWTAAGEVMGLRYSPGLRPGGSGRGGGNSAAPMDGVQFHPESFLTIEGPKLLANFFGVGVCVSSVARGKPS